MTGAGAQGGGPSVGLIVDPRQRRSRFGPYAGEILRAEGIGDVQELELAGVTADALRRCGVVVLCSCGAVPGLPELLGAYVEEGGRLVLIRPAVELAPLAGLEPLHQARPGAGLLVDSTAPAFGAFPYEPIQIVGALDLYRPGAETRVLARSVLGAWPVEAYPAIVERRAGRGQRGQVLSVLYDLPHTVARLRQGDPELAEVDSDGLVGVRPSDAVQWQSEPRAGMIPQAEVHQALLARAVEWLSPRPLPRVWYLPGEAPSILLLTGDLCTDCDDDWLLEEAALAERHGGTLAFYLNGETAFDQHKAARLLARGHSLSIHPFAVPFSAVTMEATLARHVETFRARYGAVPRTVRHHRLQWLGWAEQAELERRHGLELDLNFTTTRPVRNGYLFGAGRPLRFVDEQGRLIDTWQQPTLFEDDLVLGDHEISLRVSTPEACALYDQVLDESIARWHSAVAVNLHPANYMRYSGAWGRHLVATAAARGVPIWNPQRWLDFTRARDALRLRCTGAGGPRWRIDVPRGTPPAELTLLVPLRFGGQALEEPAGGAEVEAWGWRYRVVPLRGAPATFDIVYGGARGRAGQ